MLAVSIGAIFITFTLTWYKGSTISLTAVHVYLQNVSIIKIYVHIWFALAFLQNSKSFLIKQQNP